MSEDRDFLLSPADRACRPLHAIAIEVCQKHGVSAAEFFSKRRKETIVLARFEFCHRARTESTASFPEIGRFMHRDHTSVMNAVDRYPALRAKLSKPDLDIHS